MFNFGGGAGPGNSGMFQGALSRGVTPQDMNRLIEAYKKEGRPLPNLNPPQGTNPRPIAGGASAGGALGQAMGNAPSLGAGVGGSLGQAIGNVAGISFDINESPKNRKMRGIRKLSETGTGGEKDAAIEKMKQMGGPQLPLALGGGVFPVGNMGGMIGGLMSRGIVN